jgi:hypothetical protein
MENSVVDCSNNHIIDIIKSIYMNLHELMCSYEIKNYENSNNMFK